MKNTAKPGDTVKITASSDECKKDGKDTEIQYTGILMPRPDILDKGFTVLKLDNGYNIGIDEKKIKKITVLKPYVKKVQEKKKLKVNPKLPSVSILSTGGTISSKIDYRTGGVYADYTAEDFAAMCPELENIANIRAKKVMSAMTEDFVYTDWQKMAKFAVAELSKKDVDGVVLTMGTDMMHYAAEAMSFMVKDINKPLIITGSQRSIDRGSSDAFMNLICSVKAAAKMDFAGVAICMHGSTDDDFCLVNRGTKVRKMHTSRRDAFRPINELSLARVPLKGDIEIVNPDFPKRNDNRPKEKSDFCDKVALLQIYPSIDGSLIDHLVDKGYRGIILSATALGHVPTGKENSILPNIERAIKKGVIVVIASQTLYGRTHPYVYTNLRKLSVQLSCIFAEDMLPETAYTKLGWVLGQIKDTNKKENQQKAKELFLTNISGEITERTSAESFLY